MTDEFIQNSTTFLRKLVRHRLVDLDLDRPGSYRVVMKHLPRPVSLQSFSMTMTGYRHGPAAKQLLQDILGVLDRFPIEAPSSPCDDIHNPKSERNDF